jgi:hypothetical protein
MQLKASPGPMYGSQAEDFSARLWANRNPNLMEPGEAALDKVSGKSARHEGDPGWVVDIRKGGGQDVVLDILTYDDVALQAATATRALSTRKQFCSTTNAKIPSFVQVP